MGVLIHFTFIFFLCIFNTFGEPFQSSPTRCEEECKKYETINQNNVPSAIIGSKYAACATGCRLYRVITLTTPNILPFVSETNESLPKIQCEKSCEQSYNETLSVACKDGCTIQEVTKEVAMLRENKDEESESSGFMRLHPVMQIREISSKVVGMMRIIKSSLILFFMREDDQTMVAIQGPVKIQIEELPMIEPGVMQMEAIANEVPEFGVEGDELQERITSNKIGYPEVHAREVPSPSLLMKYTLASGLATMGVVFFGLLLCILAPVSDKLEESLIGETLVPQLPAKDSQVFVKVIRTEDLTKLSLDEDEKLGKIGLKMPESTQI